MFSSFLTLIISTNTTLHTLSGIKISKVHQRLCPNLCIRVFLRMYLAFLLYLSMYIFFLFKPWSSQSPLLCKSFLALKSQRYAGGNAQIYACMFYFVYISLLYCICLCLFLLFKPWSSQPTPLHIHYLELKSQRYAKCYAQIYACIYCCVCVSPFYGICLC